MMLTQATPQRELEGRKVTVNKSSTPYPLKEIDNLHHQDYHARRSLSVNMAVRGNGLRDRSLLYISNPKQVVEKTFLTFKTLQFIEHTENESLDSGFPLGSRTRGLQNQQRIKKPLSVFTAPKRLEALANIFVTEHREYPIAKLVNSCNSSSKLQK